MKNRDVNKYLLIAAHGLAKMGNSLQDVVFILLIVGLLQGNEFQMGLVITIQFIPYLFLGYLGGVVADRYNRKTNMLIADAIRFSLALALTYLVFFNRESVALLACIAFLSTTCRCFYQPAQQAMLPELVKKAELTKYNSRFQVSENLGVIAGPLIAGVIVTVGEYWQAFLFDAMTYLVSLILVFLINYSPLSKNGRMSETNEIRFNIFRYLNSRRKLFDTVYCSAASILAISAIIRLVIPLYITVDMNGPPELVAWTLGLIAAGTLFGAYLFGRVETKLNTPTVYWLVYGLCISMLFLSNNLFWLLGWAFVLGVSGAFVDVALICSIQRNTEGKYMGKVFSYFSTLANTGEALSGIIVGVFLMVVSARYSGVLLGFICACIAFGFIIVGLLERKNHSIWPVENEKYMS